MFVVSNINSVGIVEENINNIKTGDATIYVSIHLAIDTHLGDINISNIVMYRHQNCILLYIMVASITALVLVILEISSKNQLIHT